MVQPDEDPVVGNWTLGFVGAAIIAILAFSMLDPVHPLPVQPVMPAVGNAQPVAIAACPAGTVPRSMLQIMEPGPGDIGMGHGPIIDDTTPPDETPDSE